MFDLNSIYYEGREGKERLLAKAAADPRVVAIHLDMAERYSKLVACARIPETQDY